MDIKTKEDFTNLRNQFADALGLEHPDEFVRANLAQGARRRIGYTTRMLLDGCVWLAMGKDICIVANTRTYADMLKGDLLYMARQLDLRFSDGSVDTTSWQAYERNLGYPGSPKIYLADHYMA